MTLSETLSKTKNRIKQLNKIISRNSNTNYHTESYMLQIYIKLHYMEEKESVLEGQKRYYKKMNSLL